VKVVLDVKTILLGSLQLRITLIFLLVSLAPLAVVSVFAVRTADNVIATIVTNQLENVAAEKQGLLQRWIRERKADLEVVAGASPVRTLDAAEIGPYLELVRSQYGVYTRLLVVDAAGKVRFDTQSPSFPPRERSPFAEETGIREALGGRTAMAPVHLEPGGKESVFVIATPIPGEGRNPLGAVRATVSTASILADVLRVSLGRTGESYLVDGEGTFLVHKEPGRILRENISRSESFSQIFGKAGRKPIYTDYRGIAVLGASRPVAGTDWHLVVEQDRDEAFAPSSELTRALCLAIAVTAATAVLISWLLGYYVTAPIRTLSEAARSLAAGHFDEALAGAPTRRHDEIGQLYAAFADMAGRLQEHHDRLKRRVGFTEEELRKVEARLQKTLQAAARSEHLAALGRLSSGVAHEIRTPLTSLKLFLQSCRETLDNSPEDREDFQVAMRQIHRIEATVNHFLQFARPREPVMADLDFRRLIEEALEIVGPRAKQQNVAVSSSIAERLPRAQGDLRQLSECLVNLMVNALEVMPAGGELRVSVSAEGGSGDEGKLAVRIEVADSGPGITAEDRQFLFEPFFTTKTGGSGLGLPIVQNTVQFHGGTVRVDTAPGAGATFSIHLPAVE